MLDKISYTKLVPPNVPDGQPVPPVTYTKVVTRAPEETIITAEQLENEKAALQAQLDAFSVGRSEDQNTQDDIDATIQNYKEALAALNS